jgi:hypothetical protein
MAKKVIKLSSEDIKRMVENINEEKKQVEPKKYRKIRLTESELVEFLEKVSKRAKNSKIRRS